MSDEEVIEVSKQAIQKALDNGWRPTPYQAADIQVIDKAWRNVFLTPDFAKALWGDTETKRTIVWAALGENGEYQATHKLSDWKYYLQQMVIADDPIKYLGEHLELNKPEEIKT